MNNALLVAEQTLQSSLVGATAAQAKTATVVCYRACLASAIKQGVSPHQFSIALQELIGQPY
jgi:hypothetical protein